MTLILDKDSSHQDRQQKILDFIERKKKRQQAAKNAIIDKTFGKIPFDAEKSPLDIQKEMRDEWN